MIPLSSYSCSTLFGFWQFRCEKVTYVGRQDMEDMQLEDVTNCDTLFVLASL